MMAFDAEATAIEEALKWFRPSPYLHLILPSDSISAVARAGHPGAEPGQYLARRIQNMVAQLTYQFQTAEITWTKGHAGTPGNERADARAGKAAGKVVWSSIVSLAHTKLQVWDKYRRSK
jgi:ribonuclease HI